MSAPSTEDASLTSLATQALQADPQAATPAVADPIIAMLAKRASGRNIKLKAAMREVAGGRATQEDLRLVQEHVDEIKEKIRKGEQEPDEKGEEGLGGTGEETAEGSRS